jgi:2-keto-4-pentenoate hydratase
MAAWDDPRIARGMTAQLAGRRARMAAGVPPLGWKVGFGAPAAMEKLKIAGPLVGFLMRDALIPSGGTTSLNGWVKPVAEPEIAIHIGLADPDIPFEDPEAILARNIFQRHVIVGARSRAGGATSGLVARVLRRGVEAARTSDPEALTGKLADIVRHVADLLAAFGEKLSAGDIIIAGSVVAPLFLEADETEIAHALDPIGQVAVRFTR